MSNRQLCLLLGDSGSGKTTLMQQLIHRQASRGFPTWQPSCSDGRHLLFLNEGISVHLHHSRNHFDTAINQFEMRDCIDCLNQMKMLIAEGEVLHEVILVVSAPVGVSPTTRTLLGCAAGSGVERLVAYLSKVDAFPDEDMLDLAEFELRLLLSELGYRGDEVEIFRGERERGESATFGPVDALLAALDRRVVQRNVVESVEGTVGSVRTGTRFAAILYVLETGEGGRQSPMISGYAPTFVLGGSHWGGRLTLTGCPQHLAPGAVGEVEVNLVMGVPVALRLYQRVQVHEGSRVVAIGRITRLLD